MRQKLHDKSYWKENAIPVENDCAMDNVLIINENSDHKAKERTTALTLLHREIKMVQ